MSSRVIGRGPGVAGVGWVFWVCAENTARVAQRRDRANVRDMQKSIRARPNSAQFASDRADELFLIRLLTNGLVVRPIDQNDNAAEEIHYVDRSRTPTHEDSVATRRIGRGRPGGRDARRRRAGVQLRADDDSHSRAEGLRSASAGGPRLCL